MQPQMLIPSSLRVTHPLTTKRVNKKIAAAAAAQPAMEVDRFGSNGNKMIKWCSRIASNVSGLLAKMVKIGQDDPRRILHSFKVGFALTIISVLYYVKPLFHDFGSSAMWAVFTVVVVMEFSVGATLSRGLNRTFGTMTAGGLALGAHYVAGSAGEKGEPIILAVLVFLLAAGSTFCRFVPEVKKKYDYGVIIFILTFSLVALSSYHNDSVLKVAEQRLSTIAIGVVICLFVNVLIFPVWAGEDLHQQAADNLEKLAKFLQGLGACYFGEKKDGTEAEAEAAAAAAAQDESFLDCYKSVLNSKASEEALANFARWEPGHGHFSFHHPWSQYLKIGSLSRQCAYSISMDALTACIAACEKMQTKDSEYQRRIRNACFEMSSESSKALTGLASAIRRMRLPVPVDNQHLATAIAAADKLRTTLSEAGSAAATPGILYSAAVASLLAQAVTYAQQISSAVEELARLAHFEDPPSPQQTHTATGQPVAEEHVIIDVDPTRQQPKQWPSMGKANHKFSCLP